MAAAAVRPSNRGPDKTELLVGLALALLALAWAAPLLVVAVSVALVCLRVGLRACLVGAALSLALAVGISWPDPVARLAAFAEVQQKFGIALLDRDVDRASVWLYVQAVAPYGLGYGPLLGVGVAAGVALRGRRVKRYAETPPRDACALREERIDWAVPDVLGRGVISLVSGPPGIGKGYWTWGLLRAMQERERFFGLAVHRPWWRRSWLRRARPLRVLWLTEEGPSFAKTRRDFGIRPGLVFAWERHQVHYETWPELAARVRKHARRLGCAYVVVDTIRAWCPEAERDGEHANAVMGEVRRTWCAAGLGALFVHHDTKAGGDYGKGVSGSYGLVGAVDILVELRRVQDRPRARRMLTSRRFGEMDVTATLDGHNRYVADDAVLAGVDAAAEALEAEATRPPPPLLPAHLAAIVDLLRRSTAAGLSTTAVQQQTRTAKTTVIRHLEALEKDGYVTRGGDKLTGWVWRAAALPAPPPTADPDYTRYLGSKAWADKCAAVLARAGAVCEECVTPPEEGDTLEVHHLPEAYALIPDEPLSLLRALCAGCHRRVHAARL